MKTRNGNIDININLQTKGIDYHHNNLKEPVQSDVRPEVNVKRASVPRQLDFTYYGENPVMKAYYADMADKRLRRVAYQNRDISAVEAEPSFRRAFEAPARERLEEVIPVPAMPPSEQPMPAPMPVTPLIEPISEMVSETVEPMLGEPISMPIIPELGEPVSEMVSAPVMPELGEPVSEVAKAPSVTSARTVMEPMQEIPKAPSVTSARTVMEMPFEELRSQVPKILSRIRSEAPPVRTEPPAWAEMLVEGKPPSVMSTMGSSRPSELSGAVTAKQVEPPTRDDPIDAINDFLSKQEKPIYSFKPVIQTESDLKKFFGRMRSATLKGEAEQSYLKNLPFGEFQQRENLIGMMTGQNEEQMGRRIMPNINDIIEYKLGAYLPRGIYIDDLLPENLRDEYAKYKPRKMV